MSNYLESKTYTAHDMRKAFSAGFECIGNYSCEDIMISWNILYSCNCISESSFVGIVFCEIGFIEVEYLS